MALTARHIDISGQVQGVGFRPFVYRLASDLGLSGHVSNRGAQVRILAQGEADQLAEFERRLLEEAPSLAIISSVRKRSEIVDFSRKNFTIRASRRDASSRRQVTVDLAMCPQCAAELRDPDDPRFEYPFINCTHCGPRYSIVHSVPYDRSATSMASFKMCSLCSSQYRDPQDRRFHAQPVACEKCGPRVWLANSDGREISCEDPLDELAAMLLAGKIAAIKGLGGFHLACRADDAEAVSRLRSRKQRDAKAFAVMAADLGQIRRLCVTCDEAESLLTGPIGPITLLPARPDAAVCPQVARPMTTLGVMLPYTPLHRLMFDRLARRAGQSAPALVMTSGNISDRPIEKDNDSAIEHLGLVADVLLLHNRPIVRRVEDSIVQFFPDGTSAVLRRGRGYAPQPIRLEGIVDSHPTILAVGAELKSAVCLLDRGTAILGEHLGDLKDADTYRNFVTGIGHLEKLFELHPAILAADRHPQYLSAEYARRRSRGQLDGHPATKLVCVQHHHAHAASCLTEHGLTGPAIALVCDGSGWGDDGHSWGCETLIADLSGYQRIGHLKYMPLIGGDLAAKQTWRPAMAAMAMTFGEEGLDRLTSLRGDTPRDQLSLGLALALRGTGPLSSSLGRWFDAIAWLTSLATENSYEGQAAMTLESAMDESVVEGYPFSVREGEPFQIDLRPMVRAMVEDLNEKMPAGKISTKFHNTVIAFMAECARRATGISGLSRVALTGGCFANRYLTIGLERKLTSMGLDVLRHRQVPCNDGGVALGQAAVAAWRSVHAKDNLSNQGAD